MPLPQNNLQQQKQILIALVKKKHQEQKRNLARERFLDEVLGPKEEQKPAEPPKD